MRLSFGAKVRIGRWSVVALSLAALEVAPRVGFGDAITLVPFSEMLVRAIELFRDGVMANHLRATVFAFMASFALSGVTGVLGGLVLWRFDALRRAVDPYLTVYYAIPIFVFYPVLLAILGFSLLPIIVIAWLWAVVAVMLNTAIGLRAVPEVLPRYGQSLRLSGLQMARKIYLPAAAPHIFTGLKLGMTYSIIGVIASEFVLATRGLGYLVSFSYTNFRTSDMYAGILVIFTVSWIANGLVQAIEHRLHKRVTH